jgi:alkyldihydroxyacetonephosphate synthase
LAEARAAYGFGSWDAGVDACRRILRRGATPAVLRLYDEIE